MTKCYACKYGEVTTHGCFEYCSNCNYCNFVINGEYISSAAALIGTLVSNTKFPTLDSWIDSISHMIQTHVPVIAQYTSTMDEAGRSAFMMAFADEVITHSINTELPKEVTEYHSAAASAQEGFRCECGNTEYYDIDDILVECSACRISYVKADTQFRKLGGS